MNVQEALERYQGHKLDMDSISEFDRKTLAFFADPNFIASPYLSFTLQHDITAALANYRQRTGGSKGLTGFFTWAMIKAMAGIRHFTWRLIDGAWYQFDNPPLYLTIAAGGETRIASALMDDPSQLSWPEFAERYAAAIAEGKSGDKHAIVDTMIYLIAHSISNLANLAFSSMTLHTTALPATRPLFFYGRRYRRGDATLMPLFAQIHHSNADPVLFQQLIEAFDTICTGEF